MVYDISWASSMLCTGCRKRLRQPQNHLHYNGLLRNVNLCAAGHYGVFAKLLTEHDQYFVMEPATEPPARHSRLSPGTPRRPLRKDGDMTRLVSILRTASLKKVAVWLWRPARRSMFIS